MITTTRREMLVSAASLALLPGRALAAWDAGLLKSEELNFIAGGGR
jgi:hypothetical protein